MPILIPMNTNPPPPTPGASTTLAGLNTGLAPIGANYGLNAGAYYPGAQPSVLTPFTTSFTPSLPSPVSITPLAPVTPAQTTPPASSRVASSNAPTTPTTTPSQSSSGGGGGDSLLDRILNTGAVGAVRQGVDWWLGGLNHHNNSNPSADLESTVNQRYSDILGQYGASPDFIRQAQHQFRLAWQVQGGDDGLDEASVNSLAGDVLNGMIGEWQRQQSGISNDPYGDARRQLDQDRQAQMAAVAATQAWMGPMMQQQFTRAQTDADAYAQAGQAMADQVSNPAMRAALSQLATSYSSDQSVSNALSAQQAQLTGQNTQAQATQQYDDAVAQLAQEQAQYNQDYYAANGVYPGQPAVIGGIPLAPVGPDPTQVPGGGFVPGSTVATHEVINAGAGTPTAAPAAAPSPAIDANTLAQAGPPAPPPVPPLASVPSTGTTTTSAPPQPNDANTLNTIAQSPQAPPDIGQALQGVLAQGQVDTPNGQIDSQALWNQVSTAVGSGNITPSTQYYADRLGDALGVPGAQVIALAQSQSAAAAPSIGGAPPTIPVNGAETPAAPTAVGPAGDITHMFDSWGPTYARQWYTVNASSLSRSEREHAEDWLRRHPETTTPNPGTTVPIQPLPPAPLAPIAPVNTPSSAPSTTIPQ